MATYYPNSYLSNDSYQESSCPGVEIMYQNQSSTDTSFLELLSGNMQPNPQILSQVDDQDDHNLNYQELSLSLGIQIPSSSMNLPDFQYNYLNHASQNNKVENTKYLSFNLVGTPKNGQCSISDTYDGSYAVVGRILDSKYLKPSQELLEEVANLGDALRQIKMNRYIGLHKLRTTFDEKDSKFTPLESTTSSLGELSPSEKQDLRKKLANLYSLLDEVDRKYKEYCQQLQIVETTLDVATRSRSARPYTALAHQTISRHFRCLRDTVNGQIQLTRQRLGDQDDSSDRVLPRLRNVEKRLRQQRNIHHHVGVTRHSWRPQRGLPESSVSILRAWLFEHFLNPYPKDSEKIMLAKQTGLTRSQIANWFINARVRLWKPMIEDIYKEEFGNQEDKCISSQKHNSKSLNNNSSSSENKDKDLGQLTRHIGQSIDSNPDFFNQMEVNGFGEPQLLSDYLV